MCGAAGDQLKERRVHGLGEGVAREARLLHLPRRLGASLPGQHQAAFEQVVGQEGRLYAEQRGRALEVHRRARARARVFAFVAVELEVAQVEDAAEGAPQGLRLGCRHANRVHRRGDVGVLGHVVHATYR